MEYNFLLGVPKSYTTENYRDQKWENLPVYCKHCDTFLCLFENSKPHIVSNCCFKNRFVILDMLEHPTHCDLQSFFKSKVDLEKISINHKGKTWHFDFYQLKVDWEGTLVTRKLF